MKLHFTAHHASENQVYLAMLRDKYGQHPMEDADIIVALGGDGFMLEVIHKAYTLKKPVFGMKGGTLGFLMNGFSTDGLIERLETAVPQSLYPLKMEARDVSGKVISSLAFNEVVVQRASRQAAKLKIYVDNILRIEELVCDGIMIATPAGSTAYNLSVSGPVLPIGSNVLALTPISPFRPRRWRGAIIPHTCEVRFEATEHDKRPVSLTADHTELDHIDCVTIMEDQSFSATLLYDCDHPLPERILSEQFSDY
ncbi:MAG: NAD kinase [Pseudomonadota bacterium]